MVDEKAKTSFGPARFEDDEMMVRQIDMEALLEDKALEALYALIMQMAHAIRKNHDSTNAGMYNQFNVNIFLKNLHAIEGFAKRSFPPNVTPEPE